MPELVSATVLLIAPTLLACLAVRCIRELMPPWHVGGKIDSFIAFRAFCLGLAFGTVLVLAAYALVNPFTIDMLGARIAFAFGILAAASVFAARIRKQHRAKHIRMLAAKQRTLG